MKHHQIDVIELRASSKEEREELTKFYAAAFGWNYKDWGDAYSDTHDSGLTSAIDVEPKRKNTTLVVVYSKNLEETKDSIVQAGGSILVEAYDFPGGKRFHVLDPAGNELAIWSEK